MKAPYLHQAGDYYIGRFFAMACACEVLLDTQDLLLADDLFRITWQETERIESKLSRYRDDNIVYQINHARGQPVHVDEETAQMLDYAAQCYELSDGLFDITSGVLREAWTFDGGDSIPTQTRVNELLPRIGWPKVKWNNPVLEMPEGMQLDFGGIGKEYAVDRSLILLKKHSSISCLVNYGGDIATSGLRKNNKGWIVGIENPVTRKSHVGLQGTIFELKHGAIATSGDTQRYLLKDGVRYGHILNPKTGWPVAGAPRTVSVIADTCTEAGILATMAMLQGEKAEKFLEQEHVKHWIVR